MSFADYDEDLLGEAPCEFCGDLYPLILLIEHQTIHLNGEYEAFHEDERQDLLIENNAFENIPAVENANIKPKEPVKQLLVQNTVTEPKIAVEQSQMHSSYFKPEIEVEQTQIHTSNTAPEVIKETISVQPPKTSSKTSEAKQNQFQKHHAQKVEEFTTKCGEKLLVYGADIDTMEDLDCEKQSYKTPNNPLLNNIIKEDDVEDINNLSDDDCDESLEEFWKRARDFLKRNRVKTES